MELKNGYKQTEVGLIPEDWEVKKLNSIITRPITYGIVQPGDNQEGGVFMIRSQDYTNGWNAIHTIMKVSHEVDKPYERSRVNKDDLLITVVGSNVGRMAIVPESLHKANISRSVARIAIDSSKYVSQYCYYILVKNQSILVQSNQVGGAQPVMNLKELGFYQIPLPPTREEQTAIATALSDADVIISRLEALIAKKRAIKQGAMQQLLKPKEGWEVTTYGEVFDILSTATYSRAELTTHDEVGYVHYGDIHTQWNFTLDAQQVILPSIKNEQVKGYTLIKEGDIIMADTSEDYSSIGKSVEVKNLNGKKIIAGLHTFLLRDNKNILVNGFKAYLHVSPFIKKQFDEFATGMKVYGVSKKNLANVKIPLPPKSEQTRIAQILSDMDAEIAGLEQKMGKYKLVKQGMMQELLTGKTRLV